MKRTVLQCLPSGNVHGLYTEAIDLSTLGPLRVVRASRIEFDNAAQRWNVRDADGLLLFSHPSHQACTDWEHHHFSP